MFSWFCEVFFFSLQLDLATFLVLKWKQLLINAISHVSYMFVMSKHFHKRCFHYAEKLHFYKVLKNPEAMFFLWN